MLFVLAGPSYVGKKTALAHFVKLYAFASIIPYTTKPTERRRGEVEGIKYHYVDQENSADIENEDYIYDKPFRYKNQEDAVIYAYKKSDIEKAIDSYSNFIIHASVGNAMKIYHEYHSKWEGHLYVIFMDYETRITENFFKQKFLKMDNRIIRGDGLQQSEQQEQLDELDQTEFNRRYCHAIKERETYINNKRSFDECVKADYAYIICEKLEKFILPKLIVMPTSPDRIPGPLSDVDIFYMSGKRRNDDLQVSLGGRKLEGEEFRNHLCGCGIQLTLGSTIRIIKKKLINNYIDMAESEDQLETQLSKIYQEANIATGYILKANEVILCSSEESINMPHDTYGIVSSKFSYTQLGLSIELGTSVIQPGHTGKVHFQIQNNTENSICIYPHIQVAQLLFFRTVQPSSRNYSEDATNHSYDDESISPISRFRKNNESLATAHKPGDNFFKSILENLNSKLMEKVIGFLITAVFFIWNCSQMEELVVWLKSRFVNGMPITLIAFEIAVFGCILDQFFAFVGKILMYFGEKVVGWIREKIR